MAGFRHNIARVCSAMFTFYQMFQVSSAETVNPLMAELGNGKWNIRAEPGSLLEQMQKFEELWPRVGPKRRRLAQRFKHQKLLDLFGRGEPAEFY